MPTLPIRMSALLTHRCDITVTVLLVVTACMYTTTNAQIALENGKVFEDTKYTTPIIYDANAKLKDEKSYSSTITWISCTLSANVTVQGTFDRNKDFPTSLYFMLEKTTFTAGSTFEFYDLPPNAYIHAVQTTAMEVTQPVYIIRPTTKTNNITTLIDDSTITYAEVNTVFVSLKVPPGSPYIVTHLRNAQLTNVYELFETTTCTEGSTIFLEQITCTGCRWDLVRLDAVSEISKQSALILKEISIIRHTRPTRDGLLRTSSAVFIDVSSVIAMIDIDLTDSFTAAIPLRLFFNTEFTGTGAIVLLRIQMGASGLTKTIQPTDNKNFWVVAKQNASTEMSADELRAVKFNVNTNNVIHWDGTGANGKCVQAGLALPGTATYELVNGKCEATCPEGNYLQPACTPRAVCTGVPNCKACFAHPKEKCLECLPHTTPENNDKMCKCPIRECIECPLATLCTNCTKDYKYSPELNSCFHCTIDKCAVCSDDDKCTTCEDGYKLYNNQCIACGIDNCVFCVDPEKCAECKTEYKPTTDTTKCFYCTTPFCVECYADGECGVCEDGYYLLESTASPTNNSCVRCLIDVSKCERCEIDGVCSQCITEHKPTADGKNCFHCTLPSCTECSADGVCAKCEDGYTLYNNQCIACGIEKCELCQTVDVCSECTLGHKPTANGDQCFHCIIRGCKECSIDDVCAICDDGYSLTENKCFHCTIDKCAVCKEDDKCDTCEDGYKLYNNQCIACSIDKCNFCKESGKCAECIANHKPANNGTICTNCTIPFCKECGTDGVCAFCEDGYSLFDNTCVRCPIANCDWCETDGICSQCIADHSLSPDGLRCTLCQADACHRCDFPNVCALCNAGMTANGEGKCITCGIEDCMFCLDSNRCAECSCGMVPSDDGEKCLFCNATNCKYCKSSGSGPICDECMDGYKVSNMGSCTKIVLPQWIVFLIIVAGTIVLVTAIIVSYILYLRHAARAAQIAADAEERRRNRQRNVKSGRHQIEIAVLDLGDIEDAASGVRDTLRSDTAK